MPDQDEIAFLYPSSGMNGAGCSTRVSSSQYRRATNVTLEDELPTTRPGVRVHKFGNADENSTAAEFFRINNVQGARFFNPAKGQGGIVLAESHSQIVVACGGRKFSVCLKGSGASTQVVLSDITGIFATTNLLHLVWWVDAENYAIAGDGSSNTFIWEAVTRTASESAGYNSVDKDLSKLPNGGTVMVYAHGRIVIVVNSRQILVGDSIHKLNQSTAINLLDTTEQVYWDTGTFFLPPSAMGNVIAAEILPLRNTQHGHGDILFHCEDGVFSIDINQTPRSEWKNRQLVRHALLQAGAVGPYAIGLRDGDQIYRSRHGITTIRSAGADANVEGNPQTPLSEPIRTFLDADLPEWLRFASLNVWELKRRLLCTCSPGMDGRFRWHLGIVVRNFNPLPAERSPACWEGLWTLPKQASGIIQLVNGLFSGAERMVAFVRGEDGINRLAEFCPDLQDDVLEDGSRQRIRCQLITRAVDLARPFLKKQFVSGTLFLRDVRGLLDWGVWVRPHGSTKLELWRRGRIDVSEMGDESGLVDGEPWSDGISLGNFPKTCLTGQGNQRAFEFLIRWKGYAQIEGLRLMVNPSDPEAEQVDIKKFDVSFKSPLGDEYRDYEYSGDADWTETPRP